MRSVDACRIPNTEAGQTRHHRTTLFPIRASSRSPPSPPPAAASLPTAARMTEAPFLPRERLFKQQNYFQNMTKHTYLKGRYDVITSVAIPLALAASSMFMIGRGVYNMSHGIGKKE